MGVIGDIIGGIGSAVGQIGSQRRQYKWNEKTAEANQKRAREDYLWQLEYEKQLRDEARLYDSPQKQMERYLAAGLNPNMIYGSGGSPGGAFQISAPALSGVSSAGAVDVSLPSLLDVVGQVENIANTRARTAVANTQAQINEVVAEVHKANPMLDPEIASKVAAEMGATADLKIEESRIKTTRWWNENGTYKGSLLERQIENDVNAGFKRLGLLDADLREKNQIFEGREFDIWIKDLNKKWLENGEYTPEHIRQGIMLILSRMLPSVR